MNGMEPLKKGTVLASRFQILNVLSQGQTAIQYQAADRRLDTLCIVREWAPYNCSREPNGSISTREWPPGVLHRLKWDYVRLGKELRRAAIPALREPYLEFVENRTGYWALEFLVDPQPLSLWIHSGQPWPLQQGRQLLYALLEILERLHRQGLRHGDLRPSNLLLVQNKPVLVDPGLEREWLADYTRQAAQWLDPRIAAPEQLLPLGPRGPWTDIYSACALVWWLITGAAVPESVAEKSAALLILEGDRDLCDALQSGLNPDPYLRPRSCQQLREILLGQRKPPPESPTWAELDKQLAKVQKLKAGRNECPSCEGIIHLVRAKPEFSSWITGAPLVRRGLKRQSCAACKVGVLKEVNNQDVPRFCPKCKTGWLWTQTIGLPWGGKHYTCETCKSEVHFRGELAHTSDDDQLRTWEQIRTASGRAEFAWCCDYCSAQFDVQPNGEWKLIHPDRIQEELTQLDPDEWARLAQRLWAGAGDFTSTDQDEDYFGDARGMSLLRSHHPEHPWSGCFLEHERSQWVASGKMSAAQGLLCNQCNLELDIGQENQHWKLVNPGTGERAETLKPYLGEEMDFAAWHAIARGLPKPDEIPLLQQVLNESIVQSWIRGELGTEPFWESPAWDARQKKGVLTFWSKGFRFDRGLRKTKHTWAQIASVQAVSKSSVQVVLRDETTHHYQLDDSVLGLDLELGFRKIAINAYDLAERCDKLYINRD